MKSQFMVLLTSFLLLGCSVPESRPSKRINLSESGVYAADISANGKYAVVSQVSGAIQVYDIEAQQPRFTWQHQGDATNLVDNVRFSPDDEYVVSSDSETFAIWSVNTGDPLGFWRIDESTIQDVALSNQASGILVARANGTVMFFEPNTERRIEFLGHGENKVNSIDLSANGKYALTGGNDYYAYLWSTETGQVIHAFAHPNRVTQVKLDQRARYAFTADGQNDAQIWDVQTGSALSQLQFIERQIIFTSADFSKDGKYLLTGSPAKRLMLWDINSGDEVMQWRVAPRDGPAPQSAVVYASGFIDGEAVSVSSSGNLAFWRIKGE
ncbi:WD40 repeat domain-containing protein [Glaciecola siphonariae]|uniref:WD40 repeat domain-containing protein n=1 Tax=Glaciecola siphonariae TaxID=521012 RepID=A0ABV9LSJ0_9ALTE